MTQERGEGLPSLNRIHRELEELFFDHQSELLRGDFKTAQSLLEDYERGLLLHMREEEEILLPLYQQRASKIRGGDPEVFQQEHRKIVEWLGRLKLRLTRAMGPRNDPAEALALLDDEAYFKKYMEHHSLREDRILYPELERVVGEKEKAGLMRLLTFTLEGGQEPN